LITAGSGMPYSSGGSPGAGARDLSMSTAFTITAPSGWHQPLLGVDARQQRGPSAL
jgi:hypothetical protein